MVYEQKFKDLSSTCQINSERGVLDLESEVQGFKLTGGNILFSHSRASDANIGIIANFV